MEGLFEIHVSVDPKDLLPFRLWCLDNDLKAIHVLGEVPELTFSKYTNGTAEKAIFKALSIVRNLKLSNIYPTTIRIEYVFSNTDDLIDAHAENAPTSYFEFHIKYNIVNSKDYTALREIAEEFTKKYPMTYAFVGFNSFKKNISPIISLRVPSFYKCEGAIQMKNALMGLLKQHGFRTNEEIHKEYVFYTSNL